MFLAISLYTLLVTSKEIQTKRGIKIVINEVVVIGMTQKLMFWRSKNRNIPKKKTKFVKIILY